MDSDINYIIQESLKGDKNYQEKLFKKLNPLIFKNIYKYYRPSDPITEDLLQEGYIVILQSLKDYDMSRNVHFLQHVKIRLLYFYKNYYKNNVQYNNLSIEHLKSKGREIKSKNASPLEIIILKKNKKTLYKCIEKLSIKEQDIIFYYYFEDMTMIDIARKLNIPYRSSINIKRAVLKKMRKMLEIL